MFNMPKCKTCKFYECHEAGKVKAHACMSPKWKWTGEDEEAFKTSGPRWKNAFPNFIVIRHCQFEPITDKDQIDAVAGAYTIRNFDDSIKPIITIGSNLHEKFLDMFIDVRVIPDVRYKNNQYGVHVSPEIFQELKKRQ